MVAALAAVGLASTAVLAGCSSGDDGASGTDDPAASDDGGNDSENLNEDGGGETCADNPENPLCGSSDTNMQGKSIEFGYSRIGGWPPSSAPEAMWPAFQSYAKETYGYDVSDLAFAEAPFGELFQKIAPTLASGSNEFNLMIVDSQWLGALSEPGWIEGRRCLRVEPRARH